MQTGLTRKACKHHPRTADGIHGGLMKAHKEKKEMSTRIIEESGLIPITEKIRNKVSVPISFSNLVHIIAAKM
jgi:hypothetical protein